RRTQQPLRGGTFDVIYRAHHQLIKAVECQCGRVGGASRRSCHSLHTAGIWIRSQEPGHSGSRVLYHAVASCSPALPSSATRAAVFSSALSASGSPASGLTTAGLASAVLTSAVLASSELASSELASSELGASELCSEACASDSSSGFSSGKLPSDCRPSSRTGLPDSS